MQQKQAVLKRSHDVFVAYVIDERFRKKMAFKHCKVVIDIIQFLQGNLFVCVVSGIVLIFLSSSHFFHFLVLIYFYQGCILDGPTTPF